MMNLLVKICAISVTTVLSSALAQTSQLHSNEWQRAIAEPVAESQDPASQAIARARGDVFDRFAPRPGSLWSPGSIGVRPEVPLKESDAVVEAKFGSHVAHLTPSGICVYTEVIFDPKLVLKDRGLELKAGSRFSILISGGKVQTPDGKVVSTPVRPTEFGLVPGNSYILFLRYNEEGKFYELIKSWDVTTGTATPNSSDDAERAKHNQSTFAGMSLQSFELAIQQKTGTQ